MNIPFYDQFDGYEYDLRQNVEDIIEDTFGEDISSIQKEELANSITFLIDMYSKKYYRSLDSQLSGTSNMLFANYYPNSYYPNSIFQIPALNAYQQPPINYFPPNLLPSISPTTISPNPYQMQMIPQFQLLPYDLPIRRKKGKGKTRPKRKSAKKGSKKKSNSKKESKDRTEKKVEQTSVKSSKIDKDADDSGIKTSPSNGIVERLTASNSGSISDVISVEINVPSMSNHPIRNILSSNSDEFVGMNKNEFCVTFTFKRNQVEIASYMIRRGEEVKHGQKCAQLKNWVFEISDDKNIWTEIDRQSNVSFEQNESMTFNVRQSSSRFAHYCRLRHNGETSSHATDISIKSIEFYERIKDDILIETPTNRPKWKFPITFKKS